jgi:hypothetical protein
VLVDEAGMVGTLMAVQALGRLPGRQGQARPGGRLRPGAGDRGRRLFPRPGQGPPGP